MERLLESIDEARAGRAPRRAMSIGVPPDSGEIRGFFVSSCPLLGRRGAGSGRRPVFPGRRPFNSV